MTFVLTANKDLEQLIPIPSVSNIPQAPTPWPGVTAESASTVAALLRENHVKYHCFFNNDGFHKYFVLFQLVMPL
jgi:hypothetical protein